MNPIEFQERVVPLLATKTPTHKETSTPLKPRPRPCDYCSRVVDQQVIQIFQKFLINDVWKYRKCANCHEILEKKLIPTK
jgi:hypothetical protein